MLDLDRSTLLAVRTVVCHRNGPAASCPDGTAAALILRDALPDDVEVLFASHAEAKDVPPGEGQLWCDVTPPRETARRYADAGAIVLDHHEHARDVVEVFGSRGRLGSNACGESGAVLAFEEVWRRLHSGARPWVVDAAQKFAEIAGVRDTWRKSDPRWRQACAQAEALSFWPWERLAKSFVLSDPGDFIGIGEVLLEKREERTRAALAEVVHFELCSIAGSGKGSEPFAPMIRRVAVVNSLETSDLADLVSADVLVGFRYVGDERGKSPGRLLRLSLRSRGDVDVGAIAKALGGGGHRNAAGATVASPGEDPYAAIARLFEVALAVR